MTVYVAPEVADVIALHPYLTESGFRSLPIRDQLGRQAQTIATAHQNGDARCLIKAGADPSATMHVYGGSQTPLALASISAHPISAGIANVLNDALAM